MEMGRFSSGGAAVAQSAQGRAAAPRLPQLRVHSAPTDQHLIVLHRPPARAAQRLNADLAAHWGVHNCLRPLGRRPSGRER
eukprot:654708-Pyramimonas_sp.AAC.1